MITNKSYFSNRVLKILSNLQLAITLLFIIGIVVAIGTIIEQDQSLSFYKENYPIEAPFFGFVDWQFINFFNLDKLYTTVWFFSLLFFFALTLLACTFTTQLPALKKFRLWNFLNKSSQFKKFNLKSELKDNFSSPFNYLLYSDNYHIFCQGKKNYAYTGLLGRVGPIIVHFSILLLLLGTSIGSVCGYSVQELVPRGEIFHLQNIIKSGTLSKVLENSSWRVNDFWITYSSELKIDQFYSDISLLNSKGDEIKRKTIFVNEPFPYKGITIYQTDWDIFGLKVSDTKNNVIKQVPLKKVVKENQKFWIGSIGLDNSQDSRLTFLINNLNKEIFLYNEKGTFIQKVLVGNEFTIKNNSLLIKELITSTGLQIKEDPGIGVIYLSFLILMGSIYISFLSYSQIWAVQEEDKIFIAGKANRAVLAFQEDFKKRVNKLNSIKSKL